MPSCGPYPAFKKYSHFWTTGACGYPGCRHIPGEYDESKDFTGIIAQAKQCAPLIGLETGSKVEDLELLVGTEK